MTDTLLATGTNVLLLRALPATPEIPAGTEGIVTEVIGTTPPTGRLYLVKFDVRFAKIKIDSAQLRERFERWLASDAPTFLRYHDELLAPVGADGLLVVDRLRDWAQKASSDV
jgi:hypothetical protein